MVFREQPDFPVIVEIQNVRKMAFVGFYVVDTDVLILPIVALDIQPCDDILGIVVHFETIQITSDHQLDLGLRVFFRPDGKGLRVTVEFRIRPKQSAYLCDQFIRALFAVRGKRTDLNNGTIGFFRTRLI